METTILLTFATLSRGVTAISAMMVEQLGLAMMAPFPLPNLMCDMAPGLTSGMTRGTPSVMRNAELLSTTCGGRADVVLKLFNLT